ncbi:conjugal transfer protein TraF [Aliidiomarina maris]|uniref:F plasmid transfer operon protein TraF n=2 Tax=Aliidiomarina maris TaxID=531312 RepID=A0ABY0BNJ5_9GAMM|nr:conjugal transfer protein TraF [Aliidiomarina maris]RUO18450.1 hypothetical protein CWE07_13940 [Aliidiomarina maris]
MIKNLSYSMLALTLTTAGVGVAHAADNRTQAMGGAGVANGNYYQAASLNPALVARYEDRDRLGIILPAINFEVADQDRIFDSVDDFQDAFDNLERLIRQAEQGGVDEAQLQAAREDVAARFNDISGALVGNINGQVAVTLLNRHASAQFFANANLEAFGATRLDANDVDIFLNAEDLDALNEFTSEGFVVGRLITDYGVALGRKFNVAGRDFYLGVTPKIQEIESFTYFSALSDIDEDNFDSSEFRNSETSFNFDLGFSMTLTQRISAGLVLRNMVSNEVVGSPIYSRRVDDIVTLDYKVSRQAVAALGYRTMRMSLSLDVDLLAQNYLGLTDVSQLQVFGEVRETQFVRAGYEYALGRWAQLRLGYRHDLEGTYDDAYTAGLGFSPFGRVHFNVSASYIDDRSFGAGAQLMFTF